MTLITYTMIFDLLQMPQVAGLLGGATAAMTPLGWAGAALGAAGAIGKFFTGNKQKKLANQINPQYTPYQTSQYATQNLGAAQNAYNGRMAGAVNAERNIQTQQGNQLANIGRTATDSSQALALGMASQGQANQASENLLGIEGQNKRGLLDNLQNAYGTMIGEDRFKYQDMMNKFQFDSGSKSQLMNAAMLNKQGAVSDISSLGIKLGAMGLMGLMGGKGMGMQKTIGAFNQ